MRATAQRLELHNPQRVNSAQCGERSWSFCTRRGSHRPRAAHWAAAAVLAIAVSAANAELDGGFDGSPEHPAIQYFAPAHDPVAELNQKLQDGSAELKYDQNTGYLKSVLDALHIPVESQIVAMSKTSVQRAIISPGNPRTLYFNDSVVAGFVRGGFIELAAQDPRQGVVFYTLGRNAPGTRGFSLLDKPVFRREDGCLQCHVSFNTMGVPGMLIRSVYPGSDGTALYEAGSFVTDHRSPMKERFGGWYITGESGPSRHLGNAFFTDPDKADAPVHGELLKSLGARLDQQLYLSLYSDVVSLMVFDHQMRMMNLLTRAGWESRYGKFEKASDLKTRLDSVADEVVDYLLFVDEAPLDGRIRGTSGFAEKFAAMGPRDRKGRSLREFDFERRMMRYPCSYMIYSDAFEALPSEAKSVIYHRMWDVLSGKVNGGKYKRLSQADRAAVIEILRETKKDLPAYFS